jgi:Protein of unknown function (DUF3352)
MRRSLSLLALPACLFAIALPGCGGDDDSSGPLDAGLAYLPADSPFAVAIDTDLDGDQYKALDSILGKFPFGDKTVKELIADQLAGADSGVNFEQDVEPLLGNPFVVGALDVASFVGDEQNDDFVAALETDDEDALDNLVDESGAKETGETAGATKYEDGGTIFAVDGAMVVLAGSEKALDQALERADGDGGLSKDDYEGALEGLPANSLASVYADLEELIGTSADGKAARKVKWVDALRTLGLTATASDGGVELRFNVRTDPEGLTDEDLPMAAGDESPPVLSRPGEIGLGLRDPSQVIEFAEAAFQSVDPSGFGDYEQAKQTLDSRLGISIDDDLIAQLGGDMSASLSLDGEFGVRAEPKNAAEFEKTLAKIAAVLPAFAEGAGLGDLQVEKPSGGNPFYTLGGPDGDVAAFGVTDGVFVVASDAERAGEIALQDPESVDGAEGALALRSDARALVNAVIRQFGPQLGLDGVEGFGAQLFTGPLEDLTGSMSVETDGLRGRMKLAVD